MALPDLFLLGEVEGDWECYEDQLYQIYLDEIVNSNLSFRGLPIRCQYRPESKNKHFGFWHVISEGKEEADRTPDLRCCERIHWIAYLISQAEKDTQITWWENKRSNSIHVVIWHEIENFVVILAKRNGYYLLKSAYNAESYRRKIFIRERNDFWNGLKRLKPPQ